MQAWLDRGADANSPTDAQGRTPLYAACEHGHVDAARLLLDKGAEVDRANENGLTPLMLACYKGHVELARLVLDKGAEVDRAAENGATPLAIAKLQRHHRVVALLEERLYPLPAASQAGDVEAMTQLLDGGAAVDQAKGDGKTSLWICLLYTSPSPRDGLLSRMPSSA